MKDKGEVGLGCVVTPALTPRLPLSKVREGEKDQSTRALRDQQRAHSRSISGAHGEVFCQIPTVDADGLNSCERRGKRREGRGERDEGGRKRVTDNEQLTTNN